MAASAQSNPSAGATSEPDDDDLRAGRRAAGVGGVAGVGGFDRNGGITTAAVPILRITGATPPGTHLPSEFQGAVVDRVVNVPARLLR